MGNRILTEGEIRDELARLDDVEGVKAGYDIGFVVPPGDIGITRRIDGKRIRYTTMDLLMSLDKFSDRILRPLIELPRNPRPEQVRGATHGDYTHMAITIQNIKQAMRSGEAWSTCSASQREALELTATKIGRIVCGDPNCVDHWDDIIGYATLARDRIARPAYRTPENGA